MDARAATETTPACFEANLAALDELLPTTAHRLRTAALPAFERVEADDGTPTLRWRDAGGAIRWLGRTRLPAARARGLIAGFEPGNGNVLMVEPGSGLEFAALLERLAPTAALFVLSPDAAELSLVLQQHDYSAALRGGRLIPLADDDAWEQLRDYLFAHEGTLAPQRILAWPWFQPADSHAVQTHMSAIAGAVARQRETALQALLGEDFPPRDDDEVAIIATAPQPAAWAQADRIAWGVTALGLRAAVYRADHAARAHALALARWLRRSRAGRVLLINATRGDLRNWLRPDARVQTWLTRDAAGSAAADFGDSPIVVSAPAQAAALRAAGVPADRLIVNPPAARIAPNRHHRPLLLLADGGETSPASAGLHLASHVALWDAARDIIGAAIETGSAADLPKWFERAERQSGVSISDATVRAGVFERVAMRLAPALLGQRYIAALRQAGIHFDLIGAGWSAAETPEWVGAAPEPGVGYGGVVWISLSGEPGDVLLDAVAAGALPIVRSSAAEALAMLIPPEMCLRFADSRELLGLLADLAPRLAQPGSPPPATQHVRARHTWGHRVAAALGVSAMQVQH